MLEASYSDEENKIPIDSEKPKPLHTPIPSKDCSDKVEVEKIIGYKFKYLKFKYPK